MQIRKLKIVKFLNVVLYTFLILVSSVHGADKLSKKQYIDPKGYFKILPPNGWEKQGFSNDPRGKVKFFRPTPRGTMILIIGQDSPYNNLQMLIEDTGRAARRFKQKYGALTNVEKYTLAGYPAVRFTINIPNKLKQTQVQFLVGGNYYTMAYGTSPKSYNEFLPTAMATFESFEPILKQHNKKEEMKHIIASKLRTAKNLIKLGQKQYALTIINEGIVLDPGNMELLELRKSIHGK